MSLSDMQRKTVEKAILILVALFTVNKVKSKIKGNLNSTMFHVYANKK